MKTTKGKVTATLLANDSVEFRYIASPQPVRNTKYSLITAYLFNQCGDVLL